MCSATTDASATKGRNGGVGLEPIGTILPPFVGSFDGWGYKIFIRSEADLNLY